MGKIESIGKILLSVVVPIVIAVVGLYLSHVYQEEQAQLIKARLEVDILQIAITGDEQEKVLSIKVLSYFSKKFDDPGFGKMILDISYSDVNPDSVRREAQKGTLQLSLDNPNPKVSNAAKRELDAILLRESLESADNYFKVKHLALYGFRTANPGGGWPTFG